MKLEGEIWELELIPQLVELGSQAFTGAIRFENDSVIKIVYFKEGNILSASTNDRADSIDEILLKSGKVTRDHVKQALSKRKETETLGDALLGLGFIAKRELAWARRVQLVGILRSICEWQSGTFTVVADYLPKREEGTSFPLPQIVLEVVLTDQDRAKYDGLLESGSAVFRKSSSFDGAFGSLGLNQEASGIASRIDGVLSAAEVASESGSDTFNVYKLLNALNLLGLVEKTEKSLEVSGVEAPVMGNFGEPTGPTVEMALDFGGQGPASDAEEGLGSFPATDGEVPRFESDSSVPADDLMAYDYQAPVAESLEDLGIGYGEAPRRGEASASTPRIADHEDLGSLESLRNFEVPVAQFPPIEDRIAQKQEKGRALTPPKRKRGKTGVIAAAAILVVGLLAAGGWYYFRYVRGEVPVPVARNVDPPADGGASSSDPASIDTGAIAPASETTGTPEESATASSAAVTDTSTPPPPGPSPVTTTTREPAVKPVPPTVQETPRPVAAPPTTAPTSSSSKYATQAQKYMSEAANVPFTVQFELVCRDASIEKAISAGGSKIWFVPITYRGQQCYRVFWGRYAKREDAERGVSEIPASLRGGKPSVISPGPSR